MAIITSVDFIDDVELLKKENFYKTLDGACGGFLKSTGGATKQISAPSPRELFSDWKIVSDLKILFAN